MRAIERDHRPARLYAMVCSGGRAVVRTCGICDGQHDARAGAWCDLYSAAVQTAVEAKARGMHGGVAVLRADLLVRQRRLMS